MASIPSSKQEKSVLRRFTKNFTFNAESTNLFYFNKGQNGSTFMRLVIKEEEKLRVFQECHSSDFGGYAGRDNTIQKIAITGLSTTKTPLKW